MSKKFWAETISIALDEGFNIKIQHFSIDRTTGKVKIRNFSIFDEHTTIFFGEEDIVEFVSLKDIMEDFFQNRISIKTGTSFNSQLLLDKGFDVLNNVRESVAKTYHLMSRLMALWSQTKLEDVSNILLDIEYKQ